MNHFGIDESDHMLVLEAFRGREESKKARMATLAQSASIPELVVANVFNMLEKEGDTDKLFSAFRPMIKRNNEAGNHIKRSLQELEAILSHARSLGVKGRITVSPSLRLAYQPRHFSGMICQLVIKKKKGHEILAEAARYDDLIHEFSRILNLEEDSKYQPPGGVGISISLEKMATGISDEEIEPTIDVLIFSTSHSSSVTKQKLELAKNLWQKNIRCSVCDMSMSIDDVEDLAQECGATCIAIFQENDQRLKVLSGECFRERKICSIDVLLKEIIKEVETKASVEASQNSNVSIGLQRESSASRISEPGNMNNLSQMDISYQYLQDKVQSNEKRRLEFQIGNKLSPLMMTLTPMTFVQVYVLPFSGSVIRSLIALVDFDDDKKFSEGVKELIAKHSRHRKELSSICEDINDLKSEKGESPNVFVLYSKEDDTFKSLIV